MQGEKLCTRLRVGVAALVAVLGTAIFMASTATAASLNAPDTQTTNIPQLAWAGEENLLVKCVPRELLPPGTSVNNVGGTVSLEDWSGDEHQRPVFDASIGGLGIADVFAGRGEQEGSICWAIDVQSLKPGLARYKLVAWVEVCDTNNSLLVAPTCRTILFKHDWIKIWMFFNSVILREVASANEPAQNTGDPTGGGDFNPPFTPGEVQVLVTGRFPLGNNFAGAVAGDTVVLPRDFRRLAELFADDLVTDTEPDPAVNEDINRWDVHDEGPVAGPTDAGTGPFNQGPLQEEGHVPGNGANCDPPAAGTGDFGPVDAVDNCPTPTGGGTASSFSTVFGPSLAPTYGPFDALRPLETYLPNNRLNASDAMMPEAEIRVTLAAGSLGNLTQVNKTNVYFDPTRDGPLYAPFYASWKCPGTYAEMGNEVPTTGSGVKCPPGNNFEGFKIDPTDPYFYWDFVFDARNDPNRGDPNACFDPLGNPIPTPTGPDLVVVYTDEHGEARVGFSPLNANGGLGLFPTPDVKGRCDLAAGLAGTATIRAAARYPYQQPFDLDLARRTAGPLTKRVFISPLKELHCVGISRIEAICVEEIRDVFGDPVVGAEVCFTREPRGNIDFFFGTVTIHGRTFNVTAGPTDPVTGLPSNVTVFAEDRVCVLTDNDGLAAINIASTLTQCVDVKAENMGTRNGSTGVLRSVGVIFRPNTGLPQEVHDFCPAPGTGGQPTPGGNGNGGGQTVITLNGNTSPRGIGAAPAASKAAKLVYAKLIKAKQGRYLVVRVNAPSKTVKIRVRLIGARGKAVRTVIRTIPANRQVRISGLKIAKSVKSVSVRVVTAT